MKKEFVKPWVDALRSGEYVQGTAYLCRNGAYCCLGVLCDINELSQKTLVIEDEDGSYKVIEFEGSQAALPHLASDEFGIKDRVCAPVKGGYIEIGNRQYTSLTEANDAGETFDDIADWIEENWELL